MNIHGFELDETKRLQQMEPDKAISAGRSGGTYWIDIDSYEPAELESWLKPLDLPSIVEQRCLNVGESTQILVLPDAVFLEVAVFSDAACSALANVGVICLKNLLITLHPELVHTLVERRSEHSALELKGNTTADVLVALLLLKIDQTAGAARAIRSRVSEIDVCMDRDPGSVTLEQILDAKDAVSKLTSVSEEQEEYFEVVAEAETSVLDFSHLEGVLKLLVSLAGSVNRRADRLSTSVADLRQRYQMGMQDRTNHRLAILTVISAVFLPLTLIAGIWGMNFEHMPELGLRHGYILGLGTMFLIAGVMTWLFYRRGWFE